MTPRIVTEQVLTAMAVIKYLINFHALLRKWIQISLKLRNSNAQHANEPDKQPRGKFFGIMKVGSAWLLAGYRRRYF